MPLNALSAMLTETGGPKSMTHRFLGRLKASFTLEPPEICSIVHGKGNRFIGRDFKES